MPPAMPNTEEMNDEKTIVTPIRASAAAVIPISCHAERASAPSIMSTVFFTP